jgi:alcohol-forming fatty acyl-CoA reductase
METSSVLSKTSIAQFYANKNILVTGATGFMGKVLVECLIRKCSEINCIYILVRTKKGGEKMTKF